MMPTCLWCDKPATRFCDATIGFAPTGCERDPAGRVKQLLTGLDAEHWTCDAPMCDDHARQVGWISGEAADSVDHCPHHATRGELDDYVMFADEAERQRRAVYAEALRARMQRVPSPIRSERQAADTQGGE